MAKLYLYMLDWKPNTRPDLMYATEKEISKWNKTRANDEVPLWRKVTVDDLDREHTE